MLVFDLQDSVLIVELLFFDSMVYSKPHLRHLYLHAFSLDHHHVLVLLDIYQNHHHHLLYK
jgi:hypothetical protein